MFGVCWLIIFVSCIFIIFLIKLEECLETEIRKTNNLLRELIAMLEKTGDCSHKIPIIKE